MDNTRKGYTVNFQKILPRVINMVEVYLKHTIIQDYIVSRDLMDDKAVEAFLTVSKCDRCCMIVALVVISVELAPSGMRSTSTNVPASILRMKGSQ